MNEDFKTLFNSLKMIRELDPLGYKEILFDLEEAGEELTRARENVGLPEDKELNQSIQDIKNIQRKNIILNPHAHHLLPKIHPECNDCVKQL